MLGIYQFCGQLFQPDHNPSQNNVDLCVSPHEQHLFQLADAFKRRRKEFSQASFTEASDCIIDLARCLYHNSSLVFIIVR
jgi:hypothetical protein